MVQSGDEVSDVLRNVDFMEPRAVLQFRVKVRQVAAEDAVDEALFIRFIELCEAVREDGIRAVSEEAACLAGLDVLCNVEHGLAGRDDVIGNEHVLALNRGTEVLMCDDRVAAVYNAGIIAALVEHAHVHTEHGSIVHVAVQRTFVRADDHEVFLIGGKIREVLEELLAADTGCKYYKGQEA